MEISWKRVLWMYLCAFIGSRFNITLSRAQDVKTWRLTTNFDNPRVWQDGIPPCANDKVIFPASPPITVYMPEVFSVREMVFPRDGQFIFPENASIAFTGGRQENACKGKDIFFQRPVDFWYDPSGWNITSDCAFPRVPSRRNGAVPHAFQVPCRMDKVRFPSKMSFQVHHDYPSTTVAGLQINDIGYTEQQFRSLLATPVGKMLFPDNPGIHIAPVECSDPTGCACGNDSPRVLPTICMFEVKDKALDCSDPIEVMGHCNPMCGAKITMKYKSGFALSTVLELHESVLSKPEFLAVESFTSKTHDGLIQSIFVDGSEIKGLANKAAKLIHESLSKDIKEKGMYKVESAELQKSEEWASGIMTYDRLGTDDGLSSGGVAGIVIVVIALIGTAAAFYIYKRRQIPGFSFARFDLRADKIELELGTTPHEDLQPGDIPTSSDPPVKDNAFDNPVYGTSITSESPEEVQNIREGNDFIENPMFVIFDDSSSKQGEK
ncbi:protein amnionless-like isoform X2 [Uloborus diversus]|uniref:protein amnionless-like isoform X2 n=1 Tax=Uloborus diversus TaxID=327109 RepID=UPI00240A6A99|nr:protein amnionless-like isoform X2 [Uloborus diversus]